MRNISFLSLVKCFNGCRDHTQITGVGTRIWNFSDKAIELQIRVGSILKKAHTLKPGSSKRLKGKSIYKNYMPGKGKGSSGGGMRSLLYYYDETCHPYIWIHDTGCDFSRMVKQQYISLEDCNHIFNKIANSATYIVPRFKNKTKIGVIRSFGAHTERRNEVCLANSGCKLAAANWV